MGRSRSRAPASAASIEGRAAFVLGLRELDDEDGVLGGQRDQHHEADRGEDVHLVAADDQEREGPEDGDRRAEQDGEGQGPALVLRGQDQEDHEQGEAEDRAGGHAAAAACSW
jgi:hypothetical protein